MLRIFEGLYKLAITSVFFDWRLFHHFSMLLLRHLFHRGLFGRRLTPCVMLDVSSRGFDSGDAGCRLAVNTSRLLFMVLALLEVRLAGQFEIGWLK